MSLTGSIIVLLVVSVLAANLPWLSNRPFLLLSELPQGKPLWLRLIEWGLNYVLVLLLAIGLERKVNGVIHDQQWEFFWVTLLFFAVLAMPGFIFQYDFKKYLQRYQKQSKQNKKNLD